jgi:hypothetical protein
VPTVRVNPRDTPGERADAPVEIELDDALATYVEQLEEWVAPLEHWTLTLQQGHDFGRANNVEAKLLFTGAGHTCSITFRLDQIDAVSEFERELWLTIDERDGIGKGIHLAPLGLDVELHHIVGPPLT